MRNLQTTFRIYKYILPTNAYLQSNLLAEFNENIPHLLIATAARQWNFPHPGNCASHFMRHLAPLAHLGAHGVAIFWLQWATILVGRQPIKVLGRHFDLDFLENSNEHVLTASGRLHIDFCCKIITLMNGRSVEANHHCYLWNSPSVHGWKHASRRVNHQRLVRCLLDWALSSIRCSYPNPLSWSTASLYGIFRSSKTNDWPFEHLWSSNVKKSIFKYASIFNSILLTLRKSVKRIHNECLFLVECYIFEHRLQVCISKVKRTPVVCHFRMNREVVILF